MDLTRLDIKRKKVHYSSDTFMFYFVPFSVYKFRILCAESYFTIVYTEQDTPLASNKVFICSDETIV